MWLLTPRERAGLLARDWAAQPGTRDARVSGTGAREGGRSEYREHVPTVEFMIRRARTSDVRAIRELVDANADSGHLLGKDTVTLFEDLQEFWIAQRNPDGKVIGCGALHLMWEDLAEIRTIAVADECRGHGVGQALVDALLGTARDVGVRRVFVLTFATGFFARHGFREIKGAPVSAEVYAELLRSYDEGVAEFLDLDRVKPNTLGNTRMLVHLDGDD
jgi:amino-acid N-acetyltransferase